MSRGRVLTGRIGTGAAMAALLCLVAGLSACGRGGLSGEEWRAYSARLIANGLLRTERAPADAPFTNEKLLRTFHEIMFFNEYVFENGRFVASREPRDLWKIEADPTVQIIGSTVTEADRAHVREAMARLSGATGLRIVEGSDDPTIQLMILSLRERLALKWLLETQEVWLGLAADLPGLGDTVCAAYFNGATGDEARHIIVIPAEIVGILRRSCIEEELGQAFGPAADFDGARPSVFNDDEEFALLTTHDELLLRILYDPRLKAGMTAEEAIPVVRRIVEEIRPEE